VDGPQSAFEYEQCRWLCAVELVWKHSALGTDGFPADMFDEAKFGYFRNAESDHRGRVSRLPGMLNNGQQLISQFFGRSFGTLAKNSPADLCRA